jgi:hypothetical protein
MIVTCYIISSLIINVLYYTFLHKHIVIAMTLILQPIDHVSWLTSRTCTALLASVILLALAVASWIIILSGELGDLLRLCI